jgi:transposase InsO family protein
VLDDYSHYILAYRMSSPMNAKDEEETPKLALHKAQIEQVTVYHRLRLLSDNGSAYHSKDLVDILTNGR